MDSVRNKHWMQLRIGSNVSVSCWLPITLAVAVWILTGSRITAQDSQIQILGSGGISEEDETPPTALPPIVPGPPSEIAGGVHPHAKRDSASVACSCEKRKKDLIRLAGSAHRGTFFDNDFSYRLDPDYTDWLLGDRLKRRSLFGIGCFDIGGQYRMRSHHERNHRGLGLTGIDDDFLLQRTRIYGNLTIGSRLRLYGEFIDAESNLENFAPRPIEVNRADFLNLFVDAKVYDSGHGQLTARIGRQELLFGAQRFVSPLDWANTRRNFEGVKLAWDSDRVQVDAFWVQPIRIDAASFDSPDQDQEFMGIYSKFKKIRVGDLETFYFRHLNGRGANAFQYDTVGVRWSGARLDTLWELETAYQFGENTDGTDHSAGTATLGLGRKWQEKWEPTTWLFYDWASGDNDLGTGNGYHHGFPLAHKYLGFMDLFGRRNIEDVNLRFSAKPHKKLTLLLWYHYMFLATQSDTPYSVAMTPFNGANQPGSTDLGHELDLLATWSVNARTKLTWGYSHFFSGAYYQTTSGVPYSGDASFFFTEWTTNF